MLGFEHGSRKAQAELAFWRSVHDVQGGLSSDHFEEFFTEHFGLMRAFYEGKRLLDEGTFPAPRSA